MSNRFIAVVLDFYERHRFAFACGDAIAWLVIAWGIWNG